MEVWTNDELWDNWKRAQADADRRLDLMLKQDKKIKVCQFCYARVHTDDQEN